MSTRESQGTILARATHPYLSVLVEVVLVGASLAKDQFERNPHRVNINSDTNYNLKRLK